MPEASELIQGFRPEGPIETTISHQPELLGGLAWGKPRDAHPEGAVGVHVAQLLRLIDSHDEDDERRALLRLVAIVHDSFKYRVRKLLPRTGENHHAMRARRFMERFTDDERLLATIELHDRPYAIWRKMKRKGRLDEKALETMLHRIPDHELFLRFVEIDGSSEAKDPEPVRWFRDQLRQRGLIGDRAALGRALGTTGSAAAPAPPIRRAGGRAGWTRRRPLRAVPPEWPPGRGAAAAWGRPQAPAAASRWTIPLRRSP